MGLLGDLIKAGVEEYIEENCSDMVRVIAQNVKEVGSTVKKNKKKKSNK